MCESAIDLNTTNTFQKQHARLVCELRDAGGTHNDSLPFCAPPLDTVHIHPQCTLQQQGRWPAQATLLRRRGGR
jgi:hypothetical protein